MVSSAKYTASMTGDRAQCPQRVPRPTCMLPLPSVAVWACRDRWLTGCNLQFPPVPTCPPWW
eukprot:10494131-Alexandrium_andersonii.AAC.1